MIETVDAYAPNFRRSVLGRQIFSPLDLERTFGLVDGDIFHGKLDLGQIFSARPMLGYADYRGPIEGLYLCGSGAHPGGGSRARPGITPRAKSCAISGATASRERNNESARQQQPVQRQKPLRGS